MSELRDIADVLRNSSGLKAKADIASVADALGISAQNETPVGDDTAAIKDGNGYTLFAIEGFINEFVRLDPWFAGWCGVMVNISDIAAMGGRPTAVVNAIWADGEANAAPVLAGMRAASEAFGVPIVGGHTNIKTDRHQFAVAILGRAQHLLTSFEAKPGEKLVMAVDLRGRYREPFSNWEAATDAPPDRLRGDIEILSRLAEAGLARAAKDISQAGIVGTAAMLAECSGVGMTIDLSAIPCPADVPLTRWLQTFPSFGYLIAAQPGKVDAVVAAFHARDIVATVIGDIHAGSTVSIREAGEREVVWDFAEKPLLGCSTMPRLEACA